MDRRRSLFCFSRNGDAVGFKIIVKEKLSEVMKARRVTDRLMTVVGC